MRSTESIEARMRKALEYIAQGMGIEKACHQAGISTTTFYKLKSKEEWQKEYLNARMKGIAACGKDIEEAKRMVELEKEGARIEKPHTFSIRKDTFSPLFLLEEGEKGMSNAFEQAYNALEKAFEIVNSGKNTPFWELFTLPDKFQQLYDLLWEIQHALNEIDKNLPLIKQALQSLKETHQEIHPPPIGGSNPTN
jgi:hypothetical protein